ncbi:MAG: hypothetical protein DYH04_17265 [Nitrospira sp. NTP2]|nr:hypothetical protein [Nitrospira sp. NTP2]
MKYKTLLIWSCTLLTLGGIAYAGQPKQQKQVQEDVFDMDSLMNESLNAGQDSSKIHQSERGVWILARDNSSTSYCVIKNNVLYELLRPASEEQ